jgi:hypothetical protein
MRPPSFLLAGSALVVGLLLAACTSTTATSQPSVSATGAASSALATLRVAADGPISGYSRAQFGAAWTDDNDDLDGHNGCDTRDDILRRDLTGVHVRAQSKGCIVATGSLADPYESGVRISFVRGPQSSAVQIDHVVALGNAWVTGAAALSALVRRDIGNDPLNLLAVDGHSNEAKADSDAGHWLPSNIAFRCAYVARQIAVKTKYGLTVSSAEKVAMASVLARCPDQALPVAAATPLGS